MPTATRPAYLKDAVDSLLALLFHPQCVYCGNEVGRGALCPPCGEFTALRAPWCERCGEPLTQSMGRCGSCLEQKKMPLTAYRSLWWLTPAAKEIVHKIKYGGQFEMLESLLTKAHGEFSFPEIGSLSVMPIPMHVEKWLKRGFNQSERLARWVAHKISAPLVLEGLVKIKPSAPQSSLSRAQRLVNLKRSFVWRSSERPPAKVLLVDDVLTTGSTLRACAEVLKKSGSEVWGWTMFRTPNWRSGSGIGFLET